MSGIARVLPRAGLFAAVAALLASSAWCQVPQLLNYQARLTDSSGSSLTGSHQITFAVYDAATDGTALWSETQTVVVTNGLLATLLGSVTAFPTNLFIGGERYLGVKVGTDEEMTPRKRIVSVAFSLHADKADDADTVDGIHASATPQAGRLVALDGSGKLPMAVLKVYDSGWFAVSTNNVYTKAHGLGTTRLTAQVFSATDANGTDMAVQQYLDGNGSSYVGMTIQSISSDQLTVRVYAGWYKHVTPPAGGAMQTSGYARVVALALE